jgi:hypothetical protein
MMATPSSDVLVTNEGTVFAFELLTAAAEEWVEEFVYEPMFLGSTLVVEWRYAEELARGMVEYGLSLR